MLFFITNDIKYTWLSVKNESARKNCRCGKRYLNKVGHISEKFLSASFKHDICSLNDDVNTSWNGCLTFSRFDIRLTLH